MDKELDTEIKIQLSKGFLFGAASAAHQVEGNNVNSDWWQAEIEGRVPKSGLAADHYNRYEEDFNIAKQIGLNAMRISIEWSRIEPSEGKWNSAATEHYKKVLIKLREMGFIRMVTLHHFTLPLWLAKKGGFQTKQGVEAFARFAWFVAQNLGKEIDLWVTINEPEVYVLNSYGVGKWPPFKKNKLTAIKVFKNLVSAHKAAYSSIKMACPASRIGFAKNNTYYEPFRSKNILDKVLVKIFDYFGNHYFLDKLNHHFDFIGLNYYFYNVLQFSFKHGFIVKNSDGPKSDMGWRTYPKGIYYLLKDLKKYKKTIYITENGIANARDDMRRDFILEHLYWIQVAIARGVDVRGYFYWALTDNYEWADGFGPLFGLVEINYQTQARKIRDSANVFKEILNREQILNIR